jgi:hemolysin D
VAKKTLNAETLQQQQLATGQSRKHSEAVSEIEKLKLRLAALKSQLENTRQNLLSVVAPYDAVVISLAERNAGSVVQNGQELCQLARPDGKLRARLQISEPALARVAVGQRIRFFADAFPYQRYGTLTGTLDWISPSAVGSPEGRLFVALATLEKTSFDVRGEPHRLRVGMRGEARVIVGGRRIIEYALDPIRQLRENARQ